MSAFSSMTDMPVEIQSRFKELFAKFLNADLTFDEDHELYVILFIYPSLESVLPGEVSRLRVESRENRYIYLAEEVNDGKASKAELAEYKLLKKENPELKDLVQLCSAVNAAKYGLSGDISESKLTFKGEGREGRYVQLFRLKVSQVWRANRNQLLRWGMPLLGVACLVLWLTLQQITQPIDISQGSDHKLEPSYDELDVVTFKTEGENPFLVRFNGDMQQGLAHQVHPDSGYVENVKSGTVSADRVNIRARASLIGEQITQLGKGEKVIVLDRLTVATPRENEPTDWLKIVMPAAGQTWAHMSFIQEGKVTASKLNIRAGGGDRFSIVGQLAEGDAVKEKRTAGDWIEIEHPAGAYAYIAAKFVELTSKS